MGTELPRGCQLPDSPGLRAHLAALEAWRRLPEDQQLAEIGGAAADRPPESPGDRVRVGLWCPCLLNGGAESWQLALARAVDRSKVSWQGCCLVAGLGMADDRARSALAAEMPISAGWKEARELAARCDVLVTWAELDPDRVLEGLGRRPEIVFVAHVPLAGYGGSPPPSAAGAAVHVAVSELALDAIPPAARGKARVVLNSVDPSRVVATRSRAEMRRAWSLPPVAWVAGYLGRLAREKGPIDLLELARAASSWPGPPAFVVAVGDGPERAGLERMARAAGVGNIRFPGADPDAGSVLGAFDCLVSPSRYESFGLSMAEAMLAGVPVASSRSGLAKLWPSLAWVFDGPADLVARVAEIRAGGPAVASRLEASRAFAADRFSPIRFGKEWTGILVGAARAARLARVASCPDRGGVLPLSMQPDCGCSSRELSECRAGRGASAGRVTLRECLECRS